MSIDKCCFFISLRRGAYLIFTLDILYGILFTIISIARNQAFSNTLGSPAVLWIEVILHIGYIIWCLFDVYLILKASTKWLVRIPTFYMISSGSMAFLQFLLLVLAGVFRSKAIEQCNAETQWGIEACSHTTNITYALIGTLYVIWSCAHIYFWFVVQAFSLKMEGRLRYSALKDQYLREWDDRMEINGNYIPRTGSVRSAYSVV
ncbi:hypothetical protein BJ944DRAFT_271877 [Cunninghamella echinulata]|nr:hypothetical protein BJ944DRAFT_271877 [Cunninghamella echinulata]